MRNYWVYFVTVIIVLFAVAPYFRYYAPSWNNVDPQSIFQDPYQMPASDISPFYVTVPDGKFYLKPMASYKQVGILVAKQWYHADGEAWDELSPYDLGLVWGVLAVPKNHEQLLFSHDLRRLSMKIKPGKSWNRAWAEKVANDHVIPANDQVRAGLDLVQVGQALRLEGYLVDVVNTRDTDNHWKSSMNRRDNSLTLEGCEIVYVTRLVVEGKVFE